MIDEDRYSREYRLRHRDGRWVTVWDQGQLVRDGEGRVVRVVGSTIDVTGWKDAENALRLLSEAGSALAASLDYEETLQRVAWLAVPALADWCIVDLRDEGGVARRVAVAYADPSQAELARELLAFAPSETTRRTRRAGACHGRSRCSSPTSPMATSPSAAQTPEHLRLLQAVGVLSAIVVPLRSGGRIHGAMTLATTDVSGRRFDDDDLALAEQLAAARPSPSRMPDSTATPTSPRRATAGSSRAPRMESSSLPRMAGASTSTRRWRS